MYTSHLVTETPIYKDFIMINNYLFGLTNYSTIRVFFLLHYIEKILFYTTDGLSEIYEPNIQKTCNVTRLGLSSKHTENMLGFLFPQV